MLSSSYKHEYLWGYGGYHRNPLTYGVHLNKPIPVEQLKVSFPNLKSVKIEFGKTAFRPLKIDHDEYLLQLLGLFQLEEIFIEGGHRLTSIPDALWTDRLRKLSIQRRSDDATLALKPAQSVYLDGLEVDCRFFDVSEDLFCLPTLQELILRNTKSRLANLHKATRLKHLSVNHTEAALAVDFRQFSNIRELSLTDARFENPVVDFSNLAQLENLYLRDCQCQPVGLSNTRALQSLQLANLQMPGALLPSIQFDSLPVLETVSVENCQIDYRVFLGEMPSLKRLRLENHPGIQPVLDKTLFTSEKLEYVFLKGFQAPKNLERKNAVKEIDLSDSVFADSDAFLSHFSRITVGNTENLTGIEWHELEKLEEFECHHIKEGAVLPRFGKKNQNLQRVTLRHIPGDFSVPTSWHECPKLSSLIFEDAGFTCLPAWDAFPSLDFLLIRRCPNLKLHQKILSWQNLSKAIMGSGIEPGKSVYLEDIAKITQDANVSNNTKLVLGALLFETPAEVMPIADYQTALLCALNVKSARFKQLAWQHLYLLNPGQKKEFSIDDIKGKTVVILGKLKNNKSYYKEKLEKAGCSYQTKATAQTEIVVVGEDFDLPPDMPRQGQLFVTEVTLENLIHDMEPGFILGLEDAEVHNLRKLLWSNAPENEKVVVEMVKSGGISDAILPDLLVVAKTSTDEKVKNSLKKLLKARLDEGGQKILSDRTNLKLRDYGSVFHVYAGYAPALDASQMALTFHKREKGTYWSFFNTPKSEQNPYREEVFTEIYHQFLAKPHYVDMRWKFTSKEIAFVLSQEQLNGKLKRLILEHCVLSEIMPALLLHKETLEDFQWNTDDETLPAEIEELKKLKKITAHADNYRSLPVQMANLKKLKHVFIYSDHMLTLDASLKNTIETSQFYCTKGFVFG